MTTIDNAQDHPAGKVPGAKSNLDTETFVAMAEKAVVENFNAHRKPDRSPELSTSGVNMIWFTKGIIGYKAIFESPLARGLLWSLTYNRSRGEMYLDVFGKLNNVKIDISKSEAA